MRAAERLEQGDGPPRPERPPRPPGAPRAGRKYSWAAAIVVLMGIGVAALTSSLPDTAGGLRGPVRGETLPDFAAPLALSDRAGRVNVRQASGGSDDAGPKPACTVRGEGIYNVCEARSKALVLTFLATEGTACEPQVDRVERMRGAFPGVEFAAVVSGSARADVEQIVRRRGWELPVAVDRDGALAKLYGVGVCPTTVFARAGGEVRATELGNLTEDQLRARVERLQRR